MKYFRIITIFDTLSHTLAGFFSWFIYYKAETKFFCPSVNQFVYTLARKQRGLQPRNLVQRYWRAFLRKPWSDKNRSTFFRMILKTIFLDFSTWIFLFYFTILRVFAWFSRFAAPKFGIEVLNRDFEKTLKRFLQKPF